MSVLVGNPPTWQKLYAGSRFASSVLPCGRILGHCNNPALPFCLVCGRGISAQILAWKSETRRAVLLQCLKILLAWFRARISAGQSNLYTFYDPPLSLGHKITLGSAYKTLLDRVWVKGRLHHFLTRQCAGIMQPYLMSISQVTTNHTA